MSLRKNMTAAEASERLPMPLGGIVLCGGKSTRMGAAKAMLPFGPERMLQRVVRLMSEVAAPVVVVRAASQTLPELPAGVLVVEDARSDRGPLEGLHAGLSALVGRVDAAFATSCDVPLLVPAFVRRMAERYAGHQIAVPVEGKFAHPLAAVYSTGLTETVRGLLDSDRLRPAFLFDLADTCRVPVESLRDVDAQLHSLMNLNRPGDYHAALRLAGFEPE